MTISFSGLASGLDTSSWIESLVALKKAKVTTLEEQKQDVALSQETLSGIKSFFASFRSMIEKVTDSTKFGHTEMDIFSQNLANSANVDVLTATATWEAVEATYNVLVEKLATNTTATSNYSYITHITETTSADMSSKLVNLGFNISDDGSTIGVRAANGIEYGITLEKNDTIATLIDKFREKGIEADYNQDTGVFKINVDKDDINDIDNTGIVEALFLTDVNEGYKNNTALQVERTELVYSAANLGTKLSELGDLTGGQVYQAGNIDVYANNQVYTVSLEANDTLQDFIDILKDCNVDVEFDDTGVLTITDAVIDDIGNTHILDALGLSVDLYGKSQSSTVGLSYTDTVSEAVTSSTKIKDIGSGISISGNQTFVVRNSNNVDVTITVNSNSTIGSVLNDMNNAGLSAILNKDGTIEINGGTIENGTFDIISAFELDSEPFTAMVTGNSLKEIVEVRTPVTLETRFVEDLGVRMGYLEVTTPEGTKYYEKISRGMTIADFMADMGNLGIYTSLDEETGVLEITGGSFKTLQDSEVVDLIDNQRVIIEPDGDYRQGTNLLVCLFGNESISPMQTSVKTSRARSVSMNNVVTNTYNATTTTKLGAMNLEGGTATFEVRGETRTITVDQNTTIAGLMEKLETVGINATWDEDTSRLHIDNAVITGGTSNLDDVLGMTTTISGKYVTSKQLYNQETIRVDASLDTTLYHFGVRGNETVTLYNSDGDTVLGTTVVNSSTSLNDLIGWINTTGESVGCAASFSDGVLTITGGYIKNATLEEGMGLDTSVKNSFVLGSIKTITTTSTVTGDVKLGNIIATLGTTDKVSGGYNLSFNGTVLSGITQNTTIDDIIGKIYAQGGTAYLDATGRLAINGGTLTGSVAEALGVITVTKTESVAATGEDLTTTTVEYAHRDTRLCDLGVTGSTSIIVRDTLDRAVATVSFANTDTLGDVFDTLKSSYGIDGTVSDGIIQLTSMNGNYVTGVLATHLGIGSIVTTEIDTKTQSSTIDVTHTYTTTSGSTQTSTAAVTYTTTNTSGTTVTGSATTYNVVSGIDENNKISDAVTITNGTMLVCNSSGTVISTIVANNTTTFKELFVQLGAQNIDADMHNGIITLISQDGNYVQASGLATTLGIGDVTSTVTVTTGVSQTSSAALTYTTTNTSGTTVTGSATTYNEVSGIDENNKISDAVTITNGTMLVCNSSGTVISTIVANNTTTFKELFVQLGAQNIDADMHNGIITLISQDGNYVQASGLATTLGIGDVTSTVTVTTGVSQTSSAALTYTTTNTSGTTVTGSATTYNEVSGIDENNKISDVIAISTSNNKMIVKNGNGTAISTITVDNTTTFSNLFAQLGAQNIDADMHNGIITLISQDGNYVDASGLATALGIGVATSTTTTTSGVSKSSSAAVTYATVTTAGTSVTGSGKSITTTATTYSTAAETTKLSDLGVSNGSVVIMKDGAAVGTVNVTSTMVIGSTSTAGSFLKALADKGVYGSIEDGVITFESPDDRYIVDASGSSVLSTMGIHSYTAGETYTIGATVTGSAKTYTNTVGSSVTSSVLTLPTEATEDSKVSQFVSLATNGSVITVKTSGGATAGTVTVGANTTFGELFARLGAYDVDADLHDGTVTLTSGSGNYVAASGLATTMGITAQSTTVTNNKTVITTNIVGATESTKLSEIGVTSNGTVNILKDGNVVGSVQISTTMAIGSTDTAGSFLGVLAAQGVYGTISDGVITFVSPDDRYITDAGSGTVLAQMGIHSYTAGETYTVGASVSGTQKFYTLTTGTSQTSSVNIIATVTGDATRDTKIKTIISWWEDEEYRIMSMYDCQSETDNYYTFDEDATIGDLFDWAGSYGVNFTISDGVINLLNSTDNFVLGGGTDSAQEFLEDLGISAITSSTIRTGSSISSSVNITATVVEHATRNTRISELVSNWTTGEDSRSIAICDGGGLWAGTIFAENTTLGELFDWAATGGVNLTISDGVISLLSTTDNRYLEGMYAGGQNTLEALGISQYISLITTGASQTSSVAITCTVETSATRETRLSEIDSAYSTTTTMREFEIHDSNGTTVTRTTLAATATIGTLFNWMSAYGINATINDGIITLDSTSGATLHASSGAAANLMESGLGIYNSTKTVANDIVSQSQCTFVETVQSTLTSTVEVVSTASSTLCADTKLSALGVTTTGVVDFALTSTGGIYGQRSLTITSNTTVRDLQNALGLGNSGAQSTLQIQGQRLSLVINNSTGTGTPGIAGTGTAVLTQLGISPTGGNSNQFAGTYATYAKVTESSTIGASGSIVLKNYSNYYTISVEATDTYDSVFTRLAAYDIEGYISDGTVTIRGTDDGNSYISSMALALKTKMKLAGLTYTTVSGVATSDTKLKDVARGYQGERTIRGVHNGEAFTITYSGTSDATYNDLFSRLGGYGFNCSIQNGTVSITTTEDDTYITYLEEFFKNAIHHSGNDMSATINANTTNGTRVTASGGNATNETTLGAARITTTNGYITVNVNGTNEVISCNANWTIGALCDALSGCGISTSFVDGKFYLNPTQGSYITGNSMAAGMKIAVNPGYSYTPCGYNTFNGTELNHTIVANATNETTLKDAGILASGSGYITVNVNGTTEVVTVTSTTTIGTLCDALNGCGISTQFRDGKFYLNPTQGTSVTGNTMAAGMKIAARTSATYEYSYLNICDGRRLYGDTIMTATNENTLRDAGILISGNGYITVRVNDTNEVITVTSTTTIGTLCDALNGCGISTQFRDGMFYLNPTGSSYIVNNSMASGMKISASGASTSSVRMARDTKLSQLGLTADTNATIVSDGTTYSFAIRTTDTVADLMDTLAGYGIASTLNDGILSVTGTGNDYIKYLGCASQLGLSGSFYTTGTATAGVTGTSDYFSKTITATTTITQTETTWTNSNSNKLSHYENINYDTKLSDLGASGNITVHSEDGNSYTVTLNSEDTISSMLTKLAAYGISGSVTNGQLTLKGNGDNYITANALAGSLKISATTYTTSSANMNKDTKLSQLGLSANTTATIVSDGTTHAFTIRTTDTVGDLMDTLAGYGIASTLNNGVLSVTGTGDDYIKYLGCASQLGLSGSYYTTNTATAGVTGTSDYFRFTTTSTTTSAMNGNTTLKQLGINDNYTVTVHSDGKDYTITANKNGTVDDLLTSLAGVGIEAQISSDGKLTLIGDNEAYITAINSTLASALGVTSTAASYKSTSTATVNATSATKLSDLGIASNVIGTVVSDGTTFTFTVNSNNTVGDLLNTLSGYGIASTLNNGIFTLTGSGNDYLLGLSCASNLKLSGPYHTTQTKTNYDNTNSSSMGTHTVVASMTGSTTLSSLGLSGKTLTVSLTSDGRNYTVTANPAGTVDDLLTTLSGYGIQGSIIDGKLTLTGDDQAYITGINGALAAGLGVTATASSYNKTTTTTVTSTSGTNLSALGVSGTNYITVQEYSTGTNRVFTVESTDTVDDVLTSLAGFGISGEVVAGKIDLTPSEGYYIMGITDNLRNALKLNTSYRTTHTVTSHDNTNSSSMGTHTVVASMTGSTTLSSLGLSGKTLTVSLTSDGKNYTVTANPAGTVDDLLTTLAGYGIQGSIIDGKLTLTGDDQAYITGINGALAAGLGVTATASSYNKTTTTTVTSTSGTNLSALGVSGTNYITVQEYSTGTNRVFTVESTDTVDDVLTSLAGFGISGEVVAGKIDLTPSEGYYIMGITDNLRNALKLNTSYRTTHTETTHDNTNSSSMGTHTVVESMTGSTTLASLGLSGKTLTVSLTSDGRNYTVTANPAGTVDDLLTTLSGYGIQGSIIDGKLTLTGDDQAYITGINSALAAGLGVTATASSYNKTTTTTVSMTTATTMAAIGVTSNQTITLNGTTAITVHATDTVDDLLTTLAGYDIVGAVENGRVTLTPNGDNYITNVTDGLKNALKLNSSYNHTTTITEGITGDTLIRDINGYSAGNGNLVVHNTNGTYTTISVDSSKTVDEFFTQISKYGFVGDIDSEGKVSIVGVGDLYLQSVSGGSNILSAFKLGNITQNAQTLTANRTSDELTHTITVAANGTTKLEELENAGSKITFSGNNVNLTLMTNSDNGGIENRTLTFTKTSTIYDVMDKLSEYGIDANIDAMGRFSVTSSSLTDFDIAGTLGNFIMGAGFDKDYGVGMTYNTTTNLVQQTVVPMDDDTILSSLGITNGNVLVHANDTTYTLNIDNTYAMSDFMSAIAEYGFTSNIDSLGRITITSNGEGYLSTLSGGSNILSVLGIEDWTMYGRVQESSVLSDTSTIVNTATMGMTIDRLSDASGNNLNITSGNIYAYQDGTRSMVYIDTSDTLETLSAKLSQYGITVGISQNGQLYFDGNDNSYLTTQGLSSSSASNILNKLNVSDNWQTRYDSTSQNIKYTLNENEKAKGSTKLLDLTDSSGNNLGITTGSYYVFSNGVRNTESITEDTTVDDLMSTLAFYGLTADPDQNNSLSVGGQGRSFLATSALSSPNSNVVSVLFEQWDFTNVYETNHIEEPHDVTATISRTTRLDNITDTVFEAGTISVIHEGIRTNITLSQDTTVGNLMDELALYGFDSVINDAGQLILRSDGNSMLERGGTSPSNALEILGVNGPWVNTNSYSSDGGVESVSTVDVTATKDTALSELGVSAGEYYIYRDGVKYTAMVSTGDTVGDFINTLKTFGLEAGISEDGKIYVEGLGNSYVADSASLTNNSHIVEKLKLKQNDPSNMYTGEVQSITSTILNINATEDTKVSDLNTGIGLVAGNLEVFVNGVKNVVSIGAGATIKDIENTLNGISGIEAKYYESTGEFIIQSGYDLISIAPSATGGTNVMDVLKLTYNEDLGGYVASDFAKADVSQKLSGYNTETKKAEGVLNVTVGGVVKTITLGADSTVSDLVNKLNGIGAQAKYNNINGQLTISGVTNMQAASTNGSGILETLNIRRSGSNYVSDKLSILSTRHYDEEVEQSVSKYADDNTQLSLLNIKSGTLSIFRDGQKAKLTVDENDTIGEFRVKVQNAFNAIGTDGSDIDISVDKDGFLRFSSKTGAEITVGSTSDTSNFTAITGMSTDATGASVSAKELYKVSTSTKVMTADLFRNGDVSEGIFTVGDAIINVDSNTTIADIVSQINNNDKSNATAFWDSIEGKLVITSRSSGASLVNIEAGTTNEEYLSKYSDEHSGAAPKATNFTDIMGLTTTTWVDAASGIKDVTKMNLGTQQIGDNAKFKINGTEYTSTSNTITSDVSRITGVTIDLKGLSEGTATELKIERDTETISNAVSDVVDAYNELMENIDSEIAKGGQLSDQTTLKMIRNQLRSLMTSSYGGGTTYKNLSAIGISTAAASASNISTSNEAVVNLTFDKTKFISSFKADQSAVKLLLAGNGVIEGPGKLLGILGEVENVVETSLNGYFTTADASYKRKISTLDDKIARANKELERYRAQLEAKFSSMDLTISRMQQQYKSFLG